MVKATKKWWPIFVLPTFAAFIIGFIVPFCEGLYLSFCKFTTINKAVWIGASNYVKVFQDPQFFTSLGFTAVFTIFSMIAFKMELKWNHLAAFFCLILAVYFVFKK